MRRLIVLSILLALGTMLFASGGQREAGSNGGDRTDHAALYGAASTSSTTTPRSSPMLEQRNPNIKLEYIVAPQQGANYVHDKEVTMLAAKDGSIDVFTIDVIWPPEYASAGWLEPLDDVFPPEEQKKYIAAMIDAQTINGKIYGVPWLNDIGHMFYRKDLLEGIGAKAPVLWTDLVQTAQKLQGPNMIGYVACFFQDQQLMCNYYEYLYSNNGRVPR